MKITLVGLTVPNSGFTGIRGMDSYIYQLGKYYLQAGNEVELLVRGGFRPSEPWIKPVYAPKFSWMAYPFFLVPRLLRSKSDVYHSDYVTTGVSLMWAKRRPSVVSLHDVILFSHPNESNTNSGNIKSWWYFKCFDSIKKADAVIVMSQNSKKEAIEYTDLEKERIHVVYNGIDHDKFFPLRRKPHKKLRIGYLGGLDGRKNVGLLVDAFKELRKVYDDIEFHVGGKGKNLEKFRQMNIKGAFFHGFIPDDRVNDFYNSLDIFVFPSLAEGFGNMVVEAMAAGTPVVSSNRTSLPEVVGDAGLLVEPEVESMTKAIAKFVNSERLRKRFSALGLERAKKFTLESCAKNTFNVYESVSGKRSA